MKKYYIEKSTAVVIAFWLLLSIWMFSTGGFYGSLAGVICATLAVFYFIAPLILKLLGEDDYQ